MDNFQGFWVGINIRPVEQGGGWDEWGVIHTEFNRDQLSL